MIIIWGTHHYGRVHGHGTEYLATRFGHLYWFPIFPMQSRWVTRELGDQHYGFDVPLSGRSVAATYLRFWAPLVALGLGVTMTIWGIAAAVALAVLSIWSWTWRTTRAGRERRRAQLNQLACGTACDPLWRTSSECHALRKRVEAAFAEVCNGRTPDDVARLGADTPMQAALAYANLRLVAATADAAPARKRARAASERVLDRLTNRDTDALSEGGPYRAQGTPEVAPADLEAAATRSEQHKALAFDQAMTAARGKAWDNDPNNPAVKAQIAANQQGWVQRYFGLDLSRRGWILLLLVAPIALGLMGYFLYENEVDARKALGELRTITDEICECSTRSCVSDVVTRHGSDEIDRLEDDARDGMFTRSDVDDLADRVRSCVRDASFLPQE